MTIVFVCGDPVVNASILPLLYSDTPLPQLVDGIRCHCLQYMVTSSIDPWHHDSPAVCPWHPAITYVATHATAPKSRFSTRQCMALHGKGVTRLYPYCYYTSLACLIPRFVSNRAHLGSFGAVTWTSHEF
ncbi:uncharacterized protein TNCV_2280651 [Trichonephila clavipes]|nr:uncharacterized protein TNCV_2280651 [Trichonephila clavipes]